MREKAGTNLARIVGVLSKFQA